MTLIANSNGPLLVDGVLVAVNDRVLIKDQADASQNGIYVVVVVGDGSNPWVLDRATDMDTSAETLQGMFCRSSAGDDNVGRFYRLTTLAPIVLDETALTFTEIPQTIEIEEAP